MSINRVDLTGNLTRDPELRMTHSGASVLSFGIMNNWTENMIDQIEEKTEKIEALPMWGGSDADTVLCDLMEQTDFECNGIAQDILDMWKRNDESGRNAIEQVFYLLTEVTFDNYLMKCDKALSN